MTQTNSAEPRKPRSIARAMGRTFGFGIPATAVMTAALAVVFAVALDGCSSKSKKTSENTVSQNSIPVTKTPDGPVPVPVATPVVIAKKKTMKRPPTVTYTDAASGVSFRYPRKYKLLTPDKGKQAQDELSTLPTNFVEPGGTNIAAIELISGEAKAFMNVSLMKGVSSEQCQQFAMVSPQSTSDETPIEPNDESGVSKVSLRGVEFAKGDEITEQLEARYYHHFEPGVDNNPGSCYEFALGLSEPPESTSPVDDVAIFQQLERIFGTVKIKPEPTPTVTASVPEQQPTGVTNPQ